MKTPRTVFFTKPGLWLSLLCTAALLLAGCGGAGDANQAANAGTGGSANIRVNGMLLAASAQQPVVTSGSDDAALISSQIATAPKTLETISFALGTSNANARSVKWQFGNDASDVVGGQLTQTAALSNGVISSVTVAFKTAGIKTVTSTLYSTADASGTPLSTETIRMYVAGATVIKTASITGVLNGNTNIVKDGNTEATSLVLSGSYSSDLGADYNVQVFDAGSLLGVATSTPANKTWTYTANNLSPGAHTFTAKVVRTADSAAGKASDEYIVSVGNTVTASNSTPNIWDEFTLTLSNVWNTVRGVVFSVVNSGTELADPNANYTASENNGVWGSISMAFKTSGLKTITAKFFDNTNGTGTQVDTSTVQVNVGVGSVTQTATITDVKDGTTSIADNGSTSNTKPTITGTVNTALGTYYKVNVYDGTSPLTGNMTYGNPRTSWTFTPTTPLSTGSRTLTAKVATFDGVVTGSTSNSWTFTVNKYSPVVKAGGGSYDKTECVLDTSTGLMWEGKPASGKRGNPALDPNGRFINQLNNTSNGNAQGYVNAVNSGAGLCGFTNWRLPTKEELSGIVDRTVATSPKVDVNWFPNTQSSYYWTSSPYVGSSYYAWYVDFSDGNVSNGGRDYNGYVRLVRDTQKYSQLSKASGGVYDKTECVLDKSTGLIWEGKPAAGTKRGSPALDPNGAYTNKESDSLTTNAQGYVNAVNSGTGLCGFTDWRLPTKDELLGIVDSTVATSPKVDVNWFPNTQSAIYWTSSPYVGSSDLAWVVNFNDGYDYSLNRSSNGSYYVRLVR